VLTILEQLEAFARERPPPRKNVHEHRRTHILKLLVTPKATREVAKLAAMDIASAKVFLEALKDEGVVVADMTDPRISRIVWSLATGEQTCAN
jgi:hypothetical protein